MMKISGSCGIYDGGMNQKSFLFRILGLLLLTADCLAASSAMPDFKFVGQRLQALRRDRDRKWRCLSFTYLFGARRRKRVRERWSINIVQHTYIKCIYEYLPFFHRINENVVTPHKFLPTVKIKYLTLTILSRI